ncbi:MAG: type II toxin-antitoxin system MqsR family toxin [Proteobacteria bacterium]|nr:type II toxin-antitoxin system MqsR family toxin [Pseudomonadota bacterium]
MVNSKIKRTKTVAEYSLEGLHRLAGFKQVAFMSRRVQRHIENLGYGLDEVCAKLCALDASNFHRSENYEDDSRWHDVYFQAHPVPSNANERLYIKFRVSRDCVWIELCSFHPEGWT